MRKRSVSMIMGIAFYLLLTVWNEFQVCFQKKG